jgi:hypothetical protein
MMDVSLTGSVLVCHFGIMVTMNRLDAETLTIS